MAMPHLRLHQCLLRQNLHQSHQNHLFLYMLHHQHRSAWTLELDLRPWSETF